MSYGFVCTYVMVRLWLGFADNVAVEAEITTAIAVIVAATAFIAFVLLLSLLLPLLLLL